MVDFEKSSPEELPRMVGSQWYPEIKRGATAEELEELGYTNPETLPTRSIPVVEIKPVAETVAQEPPTRPVNHVERHPRPKLYPARNARIRQKPGHDGPPAHIAEAQRARYLASEAARKARQMVDGDSNDPPSS